MALNVEGIDNIIRLVKLTDDAVNNLAYLDCDSRFRLSLSWVRFYTSNPSFIMSIFMKRQSITMDDFEHFRVNLEIYS
jgi:hypothetical protein